MFVGFELQLFKRGQSGSQALGGKQLAEYCGRKREGRHMVVGRSYLDPLLTIGKEDEQQSTWRDFDVPSTVFCDSCRFVYLSYAISISVSF